MPAFYKFLGYAFIASLVLIAGAMIGAVLYETHISKAEPVDFWDRWQAIIGSFGVLAAIGIAIFTDLRVDRRFEEQIATQIDLAQQANNRQQAEWSRRDFETRRNEIEEQVGLIEGLIWEEIHIGGLIEDAVSFLEGLAKGRPQFELEKAGLRIADASTRRPVNDYVEKNTWKFAPTFQEYYSFRHGLPEMVQQYNSFVERYYSGAFIEREAFLEAFHTLASDYLAASQAYIDQLKEYSEWLDNYLNKWVEEYYPTTKESD